MKIQKVSEDFTKGGFMFPGLKTIYMEANTQNNDKKKKKGLVHIPFV